jgi:hypothetical protein
MRAVTCYAPHHSIRKLSFFPVNGSCSSHMNCLVLYSRSSVPPPCTSRLFVILARTLRCTCRLVYVINTYKSCMDVRKAGEQPASSCFAAPNSKSFDIQKSFLQLPRGRVDCLSVHRGNLHVSNPRPRTATRQPT